MPRPCNISDLIGEADFQCVKTVAGVFHHLGSFESVTNNGASMFSVELSNKTAGFLFIVPNPREGGR
jgi:hypothetical protein